MVAYKAIDLDSLKENVQKKIKYYSNKHNYSQLTAIETSSIEPIQNEFGECIIKVAGNIPVSLPVNTSDSFLFISSDQSKYLHGIHKYPAKFFPELPRWLIQKYSIAGETVLDPFAGSGTTNLEAILQGRNTYAVDVEDFCRLLIKVKTTPIHPRIIYQTNKNILNMLENYSPNFVKKDEIPVFPYRDTWFEDYIIYELAYIKQTIYDLTFDKDLLDFYLICFSSIIRAVSNADDGCTRTVVRKKLQKNIYPSLAISKFIETLLINSYKMEEFYNISSSCSQCIILPDSEARSIQLSNNSIDLAITSPPYVNAVDYPRTHQLELYWLDLEKGSLTPLKRKHIGTETVTVSDYSEMHFTGINQIDQILTDIYKLDKKRSFIAYKYLVDMKDNLSEVFRLLKPGKRYVIAVGNNRIRGYLFETWKYICLLAEQVGFDIEIWFISEIIKHFIKVPREERINRDYIIVLRKREDA
jgi:DNA modification methylase